MSNPSALMKETSKSLEEAIGANVKLQNEILAKLKCISKAKQQNRKRCLELTTALFDHIHHGQGNTREGKLNGDESGNTENDTKNGQKKKKAKKVATAKSKKSVWDDNPERKWKRRFFVDPDGSIPKPNDDIVQRRIWEGMLAGPDIHRFVPWSKEEIKLLLKYAKEVKNEQIQELSDKRQQQQDQPDENDSDTDSGPNTSIVVRDEDIDFHKVAERVGAELGAKKFTQNQKTRNLTHTYSQMPSLNLDAQQPRSWVDYRLKYLCAVSPSINNRPITKAESLHILTALHKHDGNPPWHKVAMNLGTNRTPFQCFQHAQTKLSNSLTDLSKNATAVLDPDEDELLFKFIAASGPQFVLNHYSASILAQRFFPHCSPIQIMHRANISLINPNFVNERWSETEERILCLGMKVYHEHEFPISMASGLLDSRAYKSISDKWCRSLNPIYSTQPYTVSEDKALLAAVKKSKVTPSPDNWKIIANQFPKRNPRSLMYRWVELAKGKDVLKLQGGQLIEKGIRNIGRKGKKKGRTADDEELGPEDFALRIKKRRRTVIRGNNDGDS